MAGHAFRRALDLEKRRLYPLGDFVAFGTTFSARFVMKTDLYIFDTLMRDLVAHSRSSAAFLVYLQLYRHTHGAGRESAAMSHQVLADLIGISKRSVQSALAHLIERRLIRQRKSRPTSVPVYTVMTPWIRNAKMS